VERMTFELFVRVKQDQNVLAAAREMAAPSSSDGPTVLVAAPFTLYPLLSTETRLSAFPPPSPPSSPPQNPHTPPIANDSSKSPPPCIPLNFPQPMPLPPPPSPT
jgi:hypothetical protein